MLLLVEERTTTAPSQLDYRDNLAELLWVSVSDVLNSHSYGFIRGRRKMQFLGASAACLYPDLDAKYRKFFFWRCNIVDPSSPKSRIQ